MVRLRMHGTHTRVLHTGRSIFLGWILLGARMRPSCAVIHIYIVTVLLGFIHFRISQVHAVSAVDEDEDQYADDGLAKADIAVV